MSSKTLIELAFLASCLATVALVLRRPHLFIRMRQREIRVETYFLGAMLGPVLILPSGLMSWGQAAAGINGGNGSGLYPVGILVLFLSMVFMSIFLDITGFFEYCARAALRYAKADGRRLFFALYGVVSFLTVFTSNDIIILTFTPCIYYFARHARIDPTPYLIAEFFAANTWSMMLYVGNPTNIVVASAFHLGFVAYTRWMLLPTVAAGVVNAWLLYRLFRERINHPLESPDDLDPAGAITDRPGVLLGVATLGACIVSLAVLPYLGTPMWVIAMAFAAALLAILAARDSFAHALRRATPNGPGSGVRLTVMRMPWMITPFILSLFVTVHALHLYGVTAEIGRSLQHLAGASAVGNVFVYGIVSAVSANLLNNIPMTLAFTSIIQSVEGTSLPSALAVAVGSNLGANLTPIGALAGIMWMGILGRKHFHISFADFVKYGLLVTPASLLACLSVLAAQFALFG